MLAAMRGASKHLDAHLVRFAGGAILCAGINNAILIIGDAYNLPYAVLLVVCYGVSASVGYAYHSRVTFDYPMTWRAFANFVGGIWLGFPVSLLLLAGLSDLLGLSMWLAAPAMTVAMVAYHYLVARVATRLSDRRRSD